MARNVRVTVDHGKCVGNAMCTATAPRVFVLNRNRQSTVANPEGDTAAQILEAAQNCPVNAITVEDADTHEKLFP